jgi:hypothetical protein
MEQSKITYNNKTQSHENTYTAPKCCVITPFVVALISIVTLSVSIIAITSSSDTA